MPINFYEIDILQCFLWKLHAVVRGFQSMEVVDLFHELIAFSEVFLLSGICST